MAKLNRAGRAAAAAKTAERREANKKKPAARKFIKNATNEGKAVAKAERAGDSSRTKVTFRAGASGRKVGKVNAMVGESFSYGSDNMKKTKKEYQAYDRGKKLVEAKGKVPTKAPRAVRKPNARRASAAKAVDKARELFRRD